MTHQTTQTSQWASEFGRDYTDRNPHTVSEMDDLYQRYFKVTRSQLNLEFLDHLDRSIRILEVGANVGTQLRSLRQMGFTHLFGIELQQYAVDQARKDCQGINLIQGSAYDIPFKDRYFDLVFTSGVLIHISPKDITRALDEIHRCSKRYIWGYEYFSQAYEEIRYRDHQGLMWKTDFAKLYLDRFEDCQLIQERKLPYVDSENIDAMFLLEKRPQS